jgi:hypothetical protein
MARAYLSLMALGAFAAVAIVAGACWLIDPLAIYSSPRIEGFDALKPALKRRIRVSKTVNAASGEWAALIVGTSRAETGLDPRHPFFDATPCFNAAIGGQSYEESLALVRAAARGGKLRRVVAVVDFEVANSGYEGATDFVPENYRPWRKAALATSLDVLGLALATPRDQDLDALFHDHALWTGDGRYVYPPTVGGSRAASIVSESDYLSVNFFRGPGLAYTLASESSQPLERIRELIAFAHAKGVALTLVIPPVHARQSEAVGAAGLWPQWEAWKRMLVRIDEEEARKASRPAFALWDFSGYNEVTTEPVPALDDRSAMRWYYESSHFNPHAGNRVLDRIAGGGDAGFGVRLTPANIDEHLRTIREGRIAWRAANPDDVAEIDATARDARLFRELQRRQRPR